MIIVFLTLLGVLIQCNVFLMYVCPENRVVLITYDQFWAKTSYCLKKIYYKFLSLQKVSYILYIHQLCAFWLDTIQHLQYQQFLCNIFNIKTFSSSTILTTMYLMFQGKNIFKMSACWLLSCIAFIVHIIQGSEVLPHNVFERYVWYR